MKYPEELLSLAKNTLKQNSGEPSRAALQCAVSTIYYALFHTLAQAGADLLIGETNTSRSKRAWWQVCRGLEHWSARKSCSGSDIMEQFPLAIKTFSGVFVDVQDARNSADYDPHKIFSKSAVENYIKRAESAMKNFKCAKEKDRRAFCAHVLFKTRSGKP